MKNFLKKLKLILCSIKDIFRGKSKTVVEVETSKPVPEFEQDRLQVPIFNGNSQGKLVVQCSPGITYFILAYDCLRPDTTPKMECDGGVVVITENNHVGEIFYIRGYVKHSAGILLRGTVFTGGRWLPNKWNYNRPV